MKRKLLPFDAYTRTSKKARYLVALAIGILCSTSSIPLIGQSIHSTSYSQNILHVFTGLGIDGANAWTTPLVRDAAGNLYGAAEGGIYDNGVIFKINTNGSYQTLYSFTGVNGDGSEPWGPIALDGNGYLYGATLLTSNLGSPGTIFKISTDGRGYQVLYNFTRGEPTAGVVLDTAGNLYGSTFGDGSVGEGTIFQLTPSGQLNVLYNIGTNPDDGEYTLGLARDSEGNLYGTSLLGGPYAGTNCLQSSYVEAFGCGTVYKVDPSGQETLLHVFSGVAGDGGSPAGAPILDGEGNLYGTTLVGGTGSCQDHQFPTGGCGTIFKVDGGDNYSVIYSFPGSGQSGAGPAGSLVLDSAGNFYGVAEDGGVGTCQGNSFNGGGRWTSYPGCGVVYELSASGTETVLDEFAGANGGNPESGLIMDSSGNLYGTTYDGGDLTECGAGSGCGTLFELSPNGSLIHHSHF